MRKVIGIGETILDIIFRNEQPSAAVPGGSVFNGIVSLSRTGVPICFISETGNDHVGNIILRFMRDNHISTDYVNVFPDGKSPVSLAFLDDNSDAEYIFYKDYPKQRLDVRTMAEYSEGHIPGTININVLDDSFAAMADSTLQKDKPVALYCRSGKRSKKAAVILSEKGYKVYELDKGFNAWQEAGEKVEK